MRALVVGSGIMGLHTALELLKRKVNVVLRSAHPPLHPNTCSQGSGALWTPYKCEDVRVSGLWAMQTLDYLLTRCRDIEIIPTLHLKKTWTEDLPMWTQDPRLCFEQRTVTELYQRNQGRWRLPNESDVLEAGYTHAFFFHTPVVNAPKVLQDMLLEIKNHPLMMQRSASDTDIVPIETGYSFNTIEDMAHHAKTLNCSFVMNCTGLGSSYLCNDSSIQGGRGILLHYDRNNCHRRLDSYPDNDQDVAIFVEDAPWASSNEACYIIPRGNVLLVGGSFKLVHSIETDPRLGSEERNRLLQNARYLGIDTSRTKPVHEWIGYRPWRPTVRVEKEYLYSDGCQEGIPVIHNYGHGGSGWTVFVGAVHEAINLALTSK